ncbi:MAG: hypothetical protein HKP41_13730 [Desulfobacterales bacterium]|nr:hypothetical protein [Deltaproteobacteria bacterium]NNK95405.1 hypothetical protein [Desulfobacterales bacterium]
MSGACLVVLGSLPYIIVVSMILLFFELAEPRMNGREQQSQSDLQYKKWVKKLDFREFEEAEE